MSAITTKDGTQLFYNDWGTGQPIVPPHGMCTTLKNQVNEDPLAFIKS